MDHPESEGPLGSDDGRTDHPAAAEEKQRERERERECVRERERERERERRGREGGSTIELDGGRETERERERRLRRATPFARGSYRKGPEQFTRRTDGRF